MRNFKTTINFSLKLLIVFCISAIPVLSQNSTNCECTPVTLANLQALFRMQSHLREDYLMDRCFELSDEGSISTLSQSYREYSKCTNEIKNREGERFSTTIFKIKLWSDQSLQFITYRSEIFRNLKTQILQRGVFQTRNEESNIDYYTISNIRYGLNSVVNKQGITIYTIFLAQASN